MKTLTHESKRPGLDLAEFEQVSEWLALPKAEFQERLHGLLQAAKNAPGVKTQAALRKAAEWLEVLYREQAGS